VGDFAGISDWHTTYSTGRLSPGWERKIGLTFRLPIFHASLCQHIKFEHLEKQKSTSISRHTNQGYATFWIFICFIHSNWSKAKLSPVDVHISSNEANAKKADNKHCIWIDRSTALPPTSAQYPSIHCRMAIFL
jgi:hypothetical protein